jgi:hypothetical protein
MCVRVFVIAVHECKSSVSSTSLFIDVINNYRPIIYSYQSEIDTLNQKLIRVNTYVNIVFPLPAFRQLAFVP